MADGSGGQVAFGFRRAPLAQAMHDLLWGELIIDLFAGGGGVSEGFYLALGREPDVAINHDAMAIGMHAVNHPMTQHFREDVWHACPVRLTAGRPVGWVHASPDCTHFSQAQGGQPRSRATRALSWVLKKWAGKLAKLGNAPRILSLENVRQILHWGPLIAKRCTAELAASNEWPAEAVGRVLKVGPGGKVSGYAACGERVPLQQQFLIPDKRHAGRTWRQFVASLRELGYVVETRMVRMDKLGAGTSRERLLMVARRDGLPICWPAQDHGLAGQPPIVTAADIIDWNNLGRSIFNRPKGLARNTIIRLLDGATRGHWPQVYIDALIALRDGRTPVLRLTPEQARDVAEKLGHAGGMVMAAGAGGVPRAMDQPIPTITAGGEGAATVQFIRPVIVHKHNTDGGRGARPIDEPVPTVMTAGAGYLAEPVLAPYYGSGSGKTGKPVSVPMAAATTRARFGIAEPVIVSTCNASARGVHSVSAPLRTVTTAKGGDFAVAEPVVREYSIDILYRMLTPRELFRASSFPDDYRIDRTADGRILTQGDQVRMCGNSVPPVPFSKIVRANAFPPELRLAA